MATVNDPFRRVILASGFAAAIVIAPMVAGFFGSTPRAGAPTAACPAGRSEDPYSVDTAAGASSKTGLTQCSGPDQGECIEGDLYAPAPVERPDTTVRQSP